jgi:hypothetical protein
MFYSVCKTEREPSAIVWSSTTVTLHTRANCMYLMVSEMAQCMKNWCIKYWQRQSYHALIFRPDKNKFYPYLNPSFFLSFFLSLDLFPPTHCRCRGYYCTWTRSVTHAPHSAVLFWTLDQLIVETSIWQHTIHPAIRRPWPRRNANPQF